MKEGSGKPECQTARPNKPNHKMMSSQYEEISEEKFSKILEQHKVWLNSDGKDGKKAYLRRATFPWALDKTRLHGINCNIAIDSRSDLVHLDGLMAGVRLSKANLIEADLSGLVLDGADFQEANLESANLEGARLVNTDFRGSNLEGANLKKVEGMRHCELRDIELLGAIGLRGTDFAGTDLTGATLPDDLAKFEDLDHVTEISKHARSIFLAVIGGCMFSWLTIAKTTDSALLTNEFSPSLPIIETEMQTTGIYWAFPIILLSSYVYLHIYLQRMWSSLARLPKIFPDGSPLDQKAYPWLLTGLVRSYSRLLSTRRPPFSRLQSFLSLTAAWVLVPATLCLFWLRYLPLRDWNGTVAQTAILVISITIGIAFYLRTKATLRGDTPSEFRWKMAWRNIAVLRFGGLATGICLFVLSISHGAIEGIPANSKETVAFHQRSVPQLFDIIGYRAFLDLVDATTRELSLSSKDLRYADAHRANFAKVDFSGFHLIGVNFANAHLEEADFADADLENVSFSGAQLLRAKLGLAFNLHTVIFERANLTSVDFSGVYLAKANLDYAILRNAVLSEAVLQNASLRGAKLQGADLTDASISGATLTDANLAYVDLTGAILTEVLLLRANLINANLTGADLDGAQFNKAVLDGAILREAILTDANFDGASLTGTNLTDAYLVGANFNEAILDGAILREAILTDANFDGASLTGTNLAGAGLIGARRLSQEQLDKACGDAYTALPKELTIKKCDDDSSG